MDNQTTAAEEQTNPAIEGEIVVENLAEDVQAELNGQPVQADTDEMAEEVIEVEAHEPTPDEIIAGLEAEVTAAQALAAEHQDRLLRVQAEFQNTTRRQEKRLMDSIERANQSLILRLLPVFDDFDLAFSNVPADLSETDAAWITGFRQIQKKLTDGLAEEGVGAIDETGSLFDPNRHEAISSEPNDEVESGHIIQTLRAGYEHKSRVLRPALVRVAA